MITLVLGGARSGKSQYAESLAEQFPQPVYLATGQAFDTEMHQRIELHQQRRGSSWTTVEEPLELVDALAQNDVAEGIILVDCLTLWLSNLLHVDRPIDAETKALVACLQAVEGSVVLVSNEVGLGIVPDNRLAREFRDHAGRLHQAVAAVADRVCFMVAGIATVVK